LQDKRERKKERASHSTNLTATKKQRTAIKQESGDAAKEVATTRLFMSVRRVVANDSDMLFFLLLLLFGFVWKFV
jgi:phosphoribosyl-ATP pyrophosphohydrolase